MPRSYWDWEEMAQSHASGFFSLHAGHQPAVRPARAMAMLCSMKGSMRCSPRHKRPRGRHPRAAVTHWGPGSTVSEPARIFPVLTRRADDASLTECRRVSRKTVLDNYNLSLVSA